MKKEILSTLMTLISSSLVAIFLAFVIIGNTALDIQLHDTYFALDRPTTTLLILTPTILITFIIKGAIHHFKTIGTNIGLIASLILSGYLSTILIHLQLNWAWILIIVEGSLAILLIVRTLKIVRG